MRPIASDFNTGGGALVDRLDADDAATRRPGPSCRAIHDAGNPADWGTLSYVADVPERHDAGAERPHGPTPRRRTARGARSRRSRRATTWRPSRYLQYRVEATSATGAATPTLSSVTLPFTAVPDGHRSDRSPGARPSPGATDVAIGTNVTVTFDEPVVPATIWASSVTLRAEGSGTDVPATVTDEGAVVTLDPLADLAATEYTVTVDASVADAAGNQLGAPDTWSFTTSAAAVVRSSTTPWPTSVPVRPAARRYVSETGDGEVILAPTVGAEFSGPSLPAGWEHRPVDRRTAVPSWRAAPSTVDRCWRPNGRHLRAGPCARVRRHLQRCAFQHMRVRRPWSLGTESWAMFSTDATGDLLLYARQQRPGWRPIRRSARTTSTSPHRYRIEWDGDIRSGSCVDGVHACPHRARHRRQPAARSRATSTPMAARWSIDWMRMSSVTRPAAPLSRASTMRDRRRLAFARRYGPTPPGTGSRSGPER